MPTGLWIEAIGKEYFLNFDEFPWFKKASVKDIYSVKLFHKHHLCWPSLDIDIDLHSIAKLEKYPLIADQ